MANDNIRLTPKEKVAQDLARQKRAADRADADRRRAAKGPAVTAYQQRQITAGEYAELVGEPYAETLREAYANEVYCARARLAVRVKGGMLTPEDYRAITGEAYNEEDF